MNDDEKVSPQIEIWKKIVDVQQHFNDLELRVRNFALIVTGAFLGLGGYAIKDGGMANLAGHHVSAAALIVGASVLPLLAFYLMDRLWYHRLLDGAVKAGIAAEGELVRLGLTVDLGTQISKASPFALPLFGTKVHSPHKMDGFYGLLSIAIIALTITLAIGVKPVEPPPSATNQDVANGALHAAVAKATCNARLAELYSKANGGPGSTAKPQDGTESRTYRRAMGHPTPLLAARAV